MKKYIIALLLMVICCSACSSQSSDNGLNHLGENSLAASFPENDLLSLSVEEEIYTESDPLATSEYQGFTQEQWSMLQDQKKKYGHLTREERGRAMFNGEIDCPEFSHLEWEHYIDGQLIYYVGADNFNLWLSATNNSDKVDIYNLAMYFSISLDELVAVLETKGLTSIYDIDTVKRRYAYFESVDEIVQE